MIKCPDFESVAIFLISCTVSYIACSGFFRQSRTYAKEIGLSAVGKSSLSALKFGLWDVLLSIHSHISTTFALHYSFNGWHDGVPKRITAKTS